MTITIDDLLLDNLSDLKAEAHAALEALYARLSPPPSLTKPYGFALARSPKAISPQIAWKRAIVIVGNILEVPTIVGAGSDYQIADWLDTGLNRLRVEAVARALIDGRLHQKSREEQIAELIDNAETELNLPPFELPGVLSGMRLDSQTLHMYLARALKLAWSDSQFFENARVASDDYNEYRAPDEYSSDEIYWALRAMLTGNARPFPFFEIEANCAAIFSMASDLFDDRVPQDSSARAQYVMQTLCADYPETATSRSVRRYRVANDERVWQILAERTAAAAAVA